MSGLWVLLLLIFTSSIPVFAAYIWFRAEAYPFPLFRFLIFFLAGAAAFFPALLMQYFFPAPASAFSAAAGRWELFSKIFFRVAFTEELSRFLILFIIFLIFKRLENRTSGAGTSPLSYAQVTRASASGLIAGLGFSVLESAVYGASDAGIILLRVFTAAPLHGACGSRIGGAAVMLKERPAQALIRFFSAAVIHSIYNFMIIMPGFPSILAVLIALSALAGSVLSIRGGMGSPNSGSGTY
jgi:RsiW-degrading membrane proteinase PrsW (M82 family)